MSMVAGAALAGGPGVRTAPPSHGQDDLCDSSKSDEFFVVGVWGSAITLFKTYIGPIAVCRTFVTFETVQRNA